MSIELPQVLDQPDTENLHRWTSADVSALIDAGVIEEGARMELIDGHLFDMPIQNPLHSTAIRLVEKVLNHHFEDRFLVSNQMPISIDDHSDPEPDLAVIRGNVRDFSERHPKANEVELLIEISRSTLAVDRNRKLKAYARGKIEDYWILNLIDRQLEVYRHPMGEKFAEVLILQPVDSISPVVDPAVVISVSELLP